MSATQDIENAPGAACRPRPVRPLYWSIRREIWENRFIFVAPAAVAMLMVGAYAVGTLHLHDIRITDTQHPGPPPAGLPFTIASVSLVLTTTITGIFYALGALYNERRDRSILFWKSLPVSDAVAVLAKAIIPLLILPLIGYVVMLAMQLAMLALAALFSARSAIPSFWTQWPFFQMAVEMPYCFAVTALWQAPIWGWLFVVSAWAKRAPVLWAFLPPLAIAVAEKLAFGSAWFCSTVFGRFTGAFDAAFLAMNKAIGPMQLDQLAPLKFVESPGLWLGLLVAAGFFAAAVRLRRLRGPI